MSVAVWQIGSRSHREISVGRIGGRVQTSLVGVGGIGYALLLLMDVWGLGSLQHSIRLSWGSCCGGLGLRKYIYGGV